MDLFRGGAKRDDKTLVSVLLTVRLSLVNIKTELFRGWAKVGA